MTGPMSGPGIGLFPTQNLYPSYLNNAPLDNPSNRITLAAGDQIPIPRGDWIVSLGMYCILEYFDPFQGIWIAGASSAYTQGGNTIVSSDGFNVRVANRTGCPVGNGIVNAYGTNYVQASTTIAVVGGGGSTWSPIVGGQLALVGATLTSNGAGYGVAPIVFIPPPPPPSVNSNGVGGIQASGYCTIASGTVSGFTFTNPGAGYPTAPTPVIMPNPSDPNIATGITQAVMAFSLTGSGSITGVLNTNPGAPLSTPNNITLTVSGAGTGATVSAIMMQTVVSASVVGPFTVQFTGGVGVTTTGGEPLSAGPATPVYGTITNGPEFLLLRGMPRPAGIRLTTTGTGSVVIAAQTGTLYDGGLFYSPPSPILQTYATIQTAAASVTGTGTITLGMGSRPDIVTIQPLM